MYLSILYWICWLAIFGVLILGWFLKGKTYKNVPVGNLPIAVFFVLFLCHLGLDSKVEDEAVGQVVERYWKEIDSQRKSFGESLEKTHNYAYKYGYEKGQRDAVEGRLKFEFKETKKSEWIQTQPIED